MFKNNEKLTDKVFMRIIVVSFIGMFICLASLCSVTWAWFTDNTKSSANTISSSSDFSLEAIAKDGDVTILAISGSGEMTETFAIGTYTVILTLPAGSSSGYLVIEDGENEYISPSVIRHAGPEDSTVTFTLVVTEESSLTFRTGWGVRSDEPSVLENGTLTLSGSSEGN